MNVGLQHRSWLWAGETGKVQISGGQKTVRSRGDWFPCSPALSTSRGWALGSPRSPQSLLWRDGETVCLAQTLLPKELVPAMGTCHSPGMTGPPVAAGNNLRGPSVFGTSHTHQLLEIRRGLP